jgi:hypothetical protein
MKHKVGDVVILNTMRHQGDEKKFARLGIVVDHDHEENNAVEIKKNDVLVYEDSELINLGKL